MYRIKKLYHRVKYRKQLHRGFALIGGDTQDFVIMNDRAFITNGQDPIVRVDLTTGEAEQYDGKGYNLTYKITPYTSGEKQWPTKT